MLRFFIFPRGRTYKTPSDEIAQRVVELVTTPGESRERLCEIAYTTLEPGNPLGKLQEALELAHEHAPLERRLRQARKEGLIASDYVGLQIDEAEKAQVISKAEANSLRDYHEKVTDLLSVDDFEKDAFRRTPAAPVEENKPAAKNKTVRKTTSKKKKATRKTTAKKKQTKA